MSSFQPNSSLITPISKPGEKLSYPKAKITPYQIQRSSDSADPDKFADFPPAITQPVECKILKSVERLTNDGALKAAYQIDIQLPDNDNLSFRVGEAMGVYVKNTDSEVDYLLSRLYLDWDSQEPVDSSDYDSVYRIHLSENQNLAKHPADFIPEKISIRNLLKNYFELRWPALSKSFIVSCIERTDDPNQKLRLKELASKQYSRTEYMTHFLQNKLHLNDFLRNFSSVKICLPQILNFIPRLKYRWYSACNSPDTDERRISFAFTQCGSEGLCSNYMLNLKKDDSIFLVQRTSTNFILPENPDIPIIMVATGTGVAPFLGFLQERTKNADQNQNQKCNNTLYYGCRHPDLDYLFKEELQKYQKQDLLNLEMCFSRYDDNKKIYVQDKLSENIEVLEEFFGEDGVLYICGDRSEMSKDVRNLLIGFGVLLILFYSPK